MKSTLFQSKQANPTTAVNNAGNGHKTIVTDGPICDDNLCWKEGKTAAGEGDRVVEYMRQLGWKRPGRGGASATDFQSPNGQDEIWCDWDQWRHMSRASGQWQELGKGTTLQELKALLSSNKLARSIMHDDSGAATGLRMQPDYGESDSYTSEINKGNSKGASEGFVITVANCWETAKEAAAKTQLYVSSTTYEKNDPMRLAKFTFSASREKALVFPRLVAQDLSQQISGPAFGAQATIVAATDYVKMFGSLTQLIPKKLDRWIQAEVDWSKKHLKKQDRIIWYLRLYRLALTRQQEVEVRQTEAENEALYNELKQQPQQPAEPQQPAQPQQNASPWGDIDPDYPTTPVPRQAAAPAVPAPQEEEAQPALAQPAATQAPPQPPAPPMKLSQRLEKLRMKFINELKSKGTGPSGLSPDVSDFPNIKQNLEHFYSLPIPAIQDKVLSAEAYGDLINSFRIAEETWQEQAVRLIRPQADDKIWMQFPNGWAWWFLGRSYCSAEAKAMGHCGNKPREGRNDQRILSLREPKQVGKETLWEPHVTFILHGGGEEGTLGEMKGRSNDKPAPQYHSYIIALMKDQRIHGFVGATWMKENNFSLMDLTEQQRDEIYQANPNLEAGGIVREFRKEGMTEKLIKRIKSVLQLEETVDHVPDVGFVFRRWDTEEELISKVGDGDARKAYKFIKSDKGAPSSIDPTDDTLTEFALDYADADVLANIGQSLANEFPKETQEWFGSERGEAWMSGGWDEAEPGFEPGEKAHVKRFFELLLEPTFTGDKAVYPKKPKVHQDKETPADTSHYKYRKVKTLEEIKNAYYWGMPDKDSIADRLEEAIELAKEKEQSGTRLVENADGYMQVMSDEAAVKRAEVVATQEQSAEEIYAPDIQMDSGWDQWQDEEASNGLKQLFAKPLTFKGKEDKTQKRLFTNPKTEEDAKKKGIPITPTSSLKKSPLWWV